MYFHSDWVMDKRPIYFFNWYIVWVVPFFKLGPSIQHQFLDTKMDRRSIIFRKSQLVPIYWVPNGWVVHFFLGIQLVPIFLGTKWVVPYYFFQISVGTGYQKGWSPLIFSKFQLVPGTKMGGWSIFFFKFSWYPFLAMGWYPTF